MRPDRRLITEAQQARRDLMLVIALGTGSSVMLVAQAWLLASVIDRVFLGGAGLAASATPLLLLPAIFAARAALIWGSSAAAGRAAAAVKHTLRGRLVAHLAALGPAYMRGERSGELSAALVEGIEALDAYLSQYLPRLALAALIPAVILAAVFPRDLLSGVVLLVTAPLTPLFMWLIGSAAGIVARRRWGLLSRMSAHFLDVLQGLTTLKLFGRSRAQLETIRAVSDRYREVTFDVLRVAFLSALALEIVGTLSTAVIAVQIGLRLLYGRMAFVDALFVLILAPELYMPLRALGAAWHASTSGLAAARRIFEVLDTSAPARRPAKTPVAVPEPPYTIAFEGVSYHYPGSSRPALSDVSFSLNAGEQVALVGASGAGKSTLADLLLRFIEPEEGQITANGVPLHLLDPALWRRRIGWVPQRPHLFNVSITENIRLGLPDAPWEAVRRAAEQAHADEFIRALPQGYDTPIGERGARLSGGQAQRIALARAFLRDAPLLVLDEATASLDPEHEGLIREAIRRLMAGRTTLMIAHRLSSVMHASRIVVLDQGQVIEQGSHEALLGAKGAYAALFTAYRGDA
ncbi:MAG: thiol reductant ABC exporter subunit CydD [Anaerolineae bacterium]